METKTNALTNLIVGLALLVGAAGLGLYLVGHYSAYQLFDKSAINELLIWGFVSLLCGASGGYLITKAYYALKS
jgi:uncharacterized protein YneF (UPF0154 family)